MLESLSSIVGILGWLITGAWMLRTWYVRREDSPRIGMKAELNRLYHDKSVQVVEVAVTIENTGEVRHIFHNLTYKIRGSTTQALVPNPKALGQVDLPIVIADDLRLFPARWGYSFVDAGQTATYRSMLVVPANVKLFKLTAKMRYIDKVSDFHSAVWFGHFG